MPASRAASALPPTAKVRRPNVVRLSSTQPATATSAKMITSVGMPNTSPEKKSRKPHVLDDLGAPVGDDLGEAAGGGEHRQRGDERHELAVGDHHAVDQPARRRRPASAVTTMTIQWKFAAICWVASVVAQTEESATIAPTDRSMPPPMITKVMPTLTTPITDGQPQDRQHVVDAGEPVAGGDDADDAEDAPGR